jgi:poly-gamma-glutamate capsule biosynthesis protein CapA/YwtB (metallophosphatase superfamily)
MNIADPMWKRYVAEADTGKMLPAIRSSKSLADCVIVSYHGGEEYASRPTRRTEWFADQVLNAGADLFLGHHPHVPHGIKKRGGKIIAYSLGNFVFYQPFQEWTQRSFALSMTIVKDSNGVHLEGAEYLPVMTGLQPFFTRDSSESAAILERIGGISSEEQEVRVAW